MDTSPPQRRRLYVTDRSTVPLAYPVSCQPPVVVLTPPNPDFKISIAKVAVPTLLITGSSSIVSAETAEALPQTNAFIVLRHLIGAGHDMLYDMPTHVAILVSGSLSDRVGSCSPAARG